MINDKKITETLSLTPEQIDELNEWINNLSFETKVSVEKIENIFIERAAEAIQAKLNEQFGFDAFMEYIKSIVGGDIINLMPYTEAVRKKCPLGGRKCWEVECTLYLSGNKMYRGCVFERIALALINIKGNIER